MTDEPRTVSADQEAYPPVPEATFSTLEAESRWVDGAGSKDDGCGITLDLVEQACRLVQSAQSDSSVDPSPGEISLMMSDVSDTISLASLAIAAYLDRAGLSALKDSALPHLDTAVTGLRQAAPTVRNAVPAQRAP